MRYESLLPFSDSIKKLKSDFKKEVLGYDYIYLRTNEENSMSYGIAKKCGFRQIHDIIQEVERRRNDGTIAKDARIFMEKKLSK